MKLKMTLAAAALLTISLSSAAAYADSVTLTLTDPNVTDSSSGGYLTPETVTFDATVTAAASNSAPVYLNGDSFNVTGPLSMDDTDFFNDFPADLTPGTSFTGALFTVTVPANTPLGIYLGSFTLLGGPNAGSSNTLASVNFSVADTPEPSSIILLLTGFAGLAMIMLWGRSKANLSGLAR